MAKIIPFARPAPVRHLMAGASIEVMPKTAAKIADFRAILPAGTRVYVAHLDGTPIEDMRATVARLVDEGFAPMPHIPARIVPDAAALNDWLAAYRDLGARSALVLAGGVAQPRGAFHCSMELLETGLFDRHGFTRLHVAGHPEGNRDIDADGSERAVMDAARWKAAFAERTDAAMAMATQFVFEAGPILDWCDRLAAAGVHLPVHVGVAGPAKLQTLIKFAMMCGVGPSIRVLQRRAADLTKLVRPFTPDAMIDGLQAGIAAGRGRQIAGLHLFPLGGIGPSAAYLTAEAPARAQA